MKKVIVFTDNFAGGGAERVASLIINGLSSLKDVEVHVCVLQDINNYKINKRDIFIHILSDPSKGHLANSFIKICNLVKVLKKIKPNTIFSFGPIMASYVYIAKKLSGLKGLEVIDSERNDPRYEPVEHWKKIIRNHCYNHADILVCQTPMAHELLKNKYGVHTKTVIIPNPISPNLPVWDGLHSKEIITAARLVSQKNLPMLIRAFKNVHSKHPDFKLTIYGEGPDRKQLETIVKTEELENVISLPGFSNDIHSVMKVAYMYVSSSDYEGISNSMLEALGIGLPCICTDCPVGGAKMFIKDKQSGLLTKVGDVNDLSEAMLYLIEHPNEAQRFSNNSSSINSILALDKITQKWLNLIN